MSHPLAERLANGDVQQRIAACREIPQDPSAVLLAPALGDALADSDSGVGQAAANALTQLGREQDISEVLHKTLRSNDPRCRIRASFVAARLAPPAPRLIVPLVEALGRPEREFAWPAARLLVDTGRLHGEVLGILLGLLRGGENQQARRMAVFCLRELAPDDPQVAQALLEATRDTAAEVRRAAFTALSGLIDPPREVEARLQEAMQAGDPAERELASRAREQLTNSS